MIYQVGKIHPFPTLVGMNRKSYAFRALETPVPHARGDEPVLARIKGMQGFRSPRSWG